MSAFSGPQIHDLLNVVQQVAARPLVYLLHLFFDRSAPKVGTFMRSMRAKPIGGQPALLTSYVTLLPARRSPRSFIRSHDKLAQAETPPLRASIIRIQSGSEG